MTKREYLLWLQAKRNQHPGITMQPSRPGPYGEPQWASFGGRPAWMDQQQVPAKDITTVIKEYEGDTPNTKTTTIKGGLLGDPAQDWDGSAAFAEQDIGMGGGGPFIGLGDPRNVRAGPDLPPAYAPNPAYAPPGSSPSMRAVYPPIPNQVPTP